MIHHNVQQGSHEWLALRRGCITGSRFKDCRDYSDGLTAQQRVYVKAIREGATEEQARVTAAYKAAPKSEAVALAIKEGPTKIWSEGALRYARDIARERCGGEAPEKFQTYAMRQGREQESRARELYEIRTGNLVETVGFFTTDDGLYGLSPDGLIGTAGALEIKTLVGSDSLFTKVAENDVSEFYDQCTGYHWGLSVEWVDLCMWVPDLDFIKIIRIPRDESEVEALESDLLDFAVLVEENESKLRKAIQK